MNIECEFFQEYRPSNAPDGVLVQHVRNCSECQEQLEQSSTPPDSPWSVDGTFALT